MTCKDCIHYEVCNEYYNEIPTDAGKVDFFTSPCNGYFKDKSRFVELPCKVGDIIYFVHREHTDVFLETLTVDMIAESKYGWNVYPSLANYTMSFPFDWFGKSVFLTIEEAEAKLKEMENKE